MIQVTNKEPFDVIFTFVRHPYFGLILEANAIKLLPNGQYSLSFQRIRENTCQYYNLTEKQTEAVKLIEEFEVDKVIKKYYTGSKRLRNNEFFIKHYTPEIHKLVRESIEKRLVKILDLIKSDPIFMVGKSGSPIETQIQYTEEPATVLFHFRRDENGTNYFATVKQSGEKVNFSANSSELITASPAWLLADGRLLHFYKNVDGQKLKPFLNKKFIHIEPHQEKAYMEKFVKPLLENHEVYAEGFTISAEIHRATPILKLTENLEGGFCLTLYFKYGNWSFPYHASKQVNVSLEKSKDGYIFHKIRRSRNWEEEKLSFLRELNLVNIQGSIFNLKEETSNPYNIIEWLNNNTDSLTRTGFILEQNTGASRYFTGKVELEIKVNQKVDWFDVYAVVKFGRFEIPFIKLRKHILDKKREFLLPDNTVAIIPDAWFERFEKIAHFSETDGKNMRLKNIHFGLLDGIEDYLDNTHKKRTNFDLFKVESIPEIDPPDTIKAQFRTYQVEGFRWIVYLHQHKMGALLADDMGLGKTLQTLAVLMYHKLNQQQDAGIAHETTSVNQFESGKQQLNLFNTEARSEADLKLKNGPSLVIAPKSLLHNWEKEARKFCPGLKTLVYSGLQRHKKLNSFKNYDLVITSYGTMRNDLDELSAFRFNCIVIDESQAIKNPASQTAKALQKIHGIYRLALTGTPIENTLLDIWSQMQFLNPGLLGSYGYFEKNYIKSIEKNSVEQTKNLEQKVRELRKILDPFVLRRTKKQVAKELPEKIEKIHYCEMTEEQEILYNNVKNQYRNEILTHVQNQGIAKSRLKIFNGLMHLRQLALNPALKDDNYGGISGKDEEIHRMLLRAIEGGHKILLFSQFVMYLKLFEEFLKEQNIDYAYLDGSMDNKQRAEQIDKFQHNHEVKVFLLSLRAGNTGLNLTGADYVFLADPWWNPFTMRQAEDRAHRIGQDKTVFSYKFITRNTIEEKILKLQEKKTLMAGNIIPDEDSIIGAINERELEEILS